MIPSDEAKQLREGITPGRWRLNEWESVVGLTIEYWDESTMEVANVKLAEAAPDLAHTVMAQAAQIERVLKVADLLDQMAGDNGRLADSLSGEYAKGKHDAYAKAAEIIRDALGDTDE